MNSQKNRERLPFRASVRAARSGARGETRGAQEEHDDQKQVQFDGSVDVQEIQRRHHILSYYVECYAHRDLIYMGHRCHLMQLVLAFPPMGSFMLSAIYMDVRQMVADAFLRRATELELGLPNVMPAIMPEDGSTLPNPPLDAHSIGLVHTIQLLRVEAAIWTGG